jgi:trans-AT polyketide synthase/acyltransferase/oxidoreductase domain-containing protein
METFVFCGQGAQKVGMGKELFELFPDLVEKADAILGYSIKELCLEDPNNRINNTAYTQPALFIVSMLEYYRQIKNGESPDFLIGHSIGEYAALCAGGAFSFENGIRLVKERGRLMSLESGGGMAAVVGLTYDKIKKVIEDNKLDYIDIANINSPKQIAISGKEKDIKEVQQLFLDAGANAYVILKVSGAFHSRYMKNAQDNMQKFISGISMNELEIPVISNYTARPYEIGKTQNTLIPQITNSVQWVDTVRYLMSYKDMEFVSMGPSPVTINLVNGIQREAQAMLAEEKNKLTKVIERDCQSVEGGINEKKSDASSDCVSHIEIDKISYSIGNAEFSKKYRTKYNYAVGGMGHGISGVDFVVKSCNEGILSFLGANCVDLDVIGSMIDQVKHKINSDTLFGVNITENYFEPQNTKDLINLCTEKGVRVIEASNFMTVTKELVRYKISGIGLDAEGSVTGNAIIAKVSNTNVAREFLKPPSDSILNELLNEKAITKDEFDIAGKIPVADDVCIVGDCAYETEKGNLLTMLPEVLDVAEKIYKENLLVAKSRIGAAGSIGSGRTILALHYMGAEFFMTGSVNECTKEADIPDDVKDMLVKTNVNDFTYAPSENMFELNRFVQVLKKGVFFPSRANMLKSVYDTVNSIDDISGEIKLYIEDKLLQCGFDNYFAKIKLTENQIKLANSNSKYKMAIIFKQYLHEASDKALFSKDRDKDVVDFQVYCGTAIGTANERLKDSKINDWKMRNTANIAEVLMQDAYSIMC